MGRRTVLVVPLVLAIAAADAAAQAPGTVAPRPSPERPADRRSPVLAAGLSAGIPLAGLGLAVASGDDGGILLGGLAMYIGPSIGQWYAGGSAAVGLLGRTAGAAVMVVGIQKAMEPTGDCDPDADPGCQAADAREAAQERESMAWFFSGLTIWTAATAWDVVMAYRTARESTREKAVTVAPVMLPSAGGASMAPGLGVTGRF